MTQATPSSPPPRHKDTYHHGDLRAALVAEGYALARQGGLEAVGVREVTRRVGVTARAAYRHFGSREALLVAVAVRAQAELARTIERRQAQVPTDPETTSQAYARGMLRAVGEGYIQYALDEPGGFEAGFFGMATMNTADDPGAAGEGGRSPYHLLLDALDRLVDLGVLPATRRDVSATYCWSAVHGFAALATRGPIKGLPRGVLDVMAAELVEATVAGLVGGDS